jgi:hypothetical protein
MARQIVLNRVYDKDYFSGSQAALYIGDVYVDEVVSYAFRTGQNKTPIYGYASQLFDAVSKGPVIVHGNFAINFKESAYLYLVLMRYKRFNEVTGKLNLGLVNPNAKAGPIGEGEFVVSAPRNLPSPFQSDEQKVLRQGIERLIQGNVTQTERFEFYQSLSGFASQVGEDLTFEDLAEAFEDEIWGIDVNNADDIVRRIDDNYFDNFDMYFTYGDYNNPDANHTVERISGIHLTGSEKAVNISGEPIIETYDFFARNSF